MRTDSTRISKEASDSCKNFINDSYGKEYINENNKNGILKGKNTQDAHEAIRPADVFRKPEDLKKLDKSLLALYDLIWKRFVASQMTPATFIQRTVIIRALNPSGDKVDYYFKATD